MQVQSTNRGQQAAAIEARCPHGSMPGACAMCGGGGGGGGGAKRNSGLMTWNEAYALWKALQLAQARNTDYLKGIAVNQDRLVRQTDALMQQNLAARLLALAIRNIALPLSRMAHASFQTIARLGGGLAETFVNLGRNLVAGFSRMAPHFDVTGRLVALLADMQKLVDDAFHHNIEVLKSLMARLRLTEQLSKIAQLVGKVFRQFLPREIFRTAARRVKGLFRKIAGWFGRKAPDEDAPSI